MEDPILISNINDFVFCPVSIYFHSLYGNIRRELYQSDKQLKGSYVHEAVDNGNYSTRKDVLTAIDVYCEKYNLSGKIDVFDVKTGILTERKRKVSKIYEGYVFQVYAQYFSLIEMGYIVNKIVIHSYVDNVNYPIPLPYQNVAMLEKFEKTVKEMHEFDLNVYQPKSENKCRNCIYSDLCDRSLV